MRWILLTLWGLGMVWVVMRYVRWRLDEAEWKALMAHGIPYVGQDVDIIEIDLERDAPWQIRHKLRDYAKSRERGGDMPPRQR